MKERKGNQHKFEQIKTKKIENQEKSSSQNLEEVPFPYLPVCFACIGMLAHAIIFTSPLPFVAYMIVDFKMADNLDSAGFAAGWITGMFMIGRSIAGIPWGIAADRYGRKVCLFMSMVNVTVFSLLFGFSINFYMAVIVRFCLGVGNGFLGIAKTYLSEIVQSKDHEVKALGFLNGIYNLGLILGPGIGGLLARPALQYPTVFASDSIWGRFPYLLPSVIGSSCSFLAAVGIALYLPETLQISKQQNNRHPGYAIVEQNNGEDEDEIEMIAFNSVHSHNKLSSSQEILKNPIHSEKSEQDLDYEDILEFEEIPINESSKGLLVSTRLSQEEEENMDQEIGTPSKSTTHSFPPSSSSSAKKPATFQEIIHDASIQNMFIVYMSFCMITMFSDEIFPLYAVTSLKSGGLSWEMKEVGETLAVVGIGLFLFQFLCFQPCLKRFFQKGQKDILVKTLFLVAITMPLLPFLGDGVIRLTAWSSPSVEKRINPKKNIILFIAVCSSILLFKMPATATFTSITMVVNASVDTTKRGTLNGLMMTAGSIGYGIGPILGSMLYALAIELAYGTSVDQQSSSDNNSSSLPMMIPVDGRIIFFFGSFLALLLAGYVWKYVQIDW